MPEKCPDCKILDKLLEFSGLMKRKIKPKAKLELLAQINAFVEKNEEVIYEKFPDALVAIFNSV